MFKRTMIMFLLLVCLILTNCIDTTTIISVRKNGSGTVTEITYISESVEAMMKGMASQMGLEGEVESEIEESKIDEDKYIAKAEKMGVGVKYVSAREVENADGAKGVEVVYAFADVTALNIDPQPENPIGDNMAGMMDAEPVEEEEKQRITFEFKKGSTSSLVVHMPKEKESEESADKEPVEPETEREENPAAMAMMKSFLDGFRIRVLIKPMDGNIRRTNATFVEAVDGKKTVTLLDMKMGEILSDEKYAKEFQKMSEMKDMSAALEKMKEIPGLKIETKKRVEIEIK